MGLNKCYCGKKASGFGTIIGFIFSFFIMIGVVSFVFFTMVEDAKSKSDLIAVSYDLVKSQSVSFTLNGVYYDGGRLRVFIENDGTENILLKSGSSICLDLFVNGNYVSRDNFDVYIDDPTGNYYLVEPGSQAVLDAKINLVENSSVDVNLVTCGNFKEEFVYGSENYNWIDSNYYERTFFEIENTLSDDLKDSYFELELNSSNFNFSKGVQDELLFALPVSNNIVLSLNFDDYNQILTDYSKYGNVVYLGSSSSSASDDPTSSEGLFIKSLSYDGINDSNRILVDNSLVFRNETTYSAWFKWSGGNGTSNDTIFRNGNENNTLKIVGDGSSLDSKVVFNLDIADVKRELSSSTQVDDSSWHNVVGTFNGSYMALYIDGILEDSLTFPNSLINSSLEDNYVGTLNNDNYFNGQLDEIKIFNIDLNSTEVSNLFSNELKYISLEYIVNSWDLTNETANISVKIPFVFANENISLELYYYYLLLGTGGVGGTTSGGTGGTNDTPLSNISAFVSLWNTSEVGVSSNDQIQLPLLNGGIYDFIVYWGDGTNSTVKDWASSNKTHTYSSAGVYTVNITGTLSGWTFNNSGDKDKIYNVMNWGSLNLGNYGYYFQGCSNLDINATDALNLTGTQTLGFMFDAATSLSTPDFTAWDTNGLTSLAYTFRGTTNFNGNISTWDVSNVGAMWFMLSGALNFNGDLSSWNTSSLNSAGAMFQGADSFTGDLDSWDTSNLISANYMFDNADNFNGNVSTWDVSNVTNMDAMFQWAVSFNQDLSGWNTDNVTTCTSFDSATLSWTLSKPTFSSCTP